MKTDYQITNQNYNKNSNYTYVNCVVTNPAITSYVLGFVKIYGVTGLLESPLYNNPIQDEN